MNSSWLFGTSHIHACFNDFTKEFDLHQEVLLLVEYTQTMPSTAPQTKHTRKSNYIFRFGLHKTSHREKSVPLQKAAIMEASLCAVIIENTTVVENALINLKTTTIVHFCLILQQASVGYEEDILPRSPNTVNNGQWLQQRWRRNLK